jgi:hypothetical protein
MNRNQAIKAKGPMKTTDRIQQKPNFDKPLGSSHKDEVDLRDVAKEAKKKSK